VKPGFQNKGFVRKLREYAEYDFHFFHFFIEKPKFVKSA